MNEDGNEQPKGGTGSYRRGALLGEGSFSWVYEATHLEDGARRAIKHAKPSREAGIGATPTGCVPTGVFAWATGVLRDVRPDASELLRVQFDTLKGIDSPDVVGVQELAVEAGSAWYAMDLVEGQTLRQLLGTGGVATAAARMDRAWIAVELAACLRRLEQDPVFRSHGDLKPENIIVSADRVVLVDPGYFGPLPDADGNVADCIVTTPAYYPWLDPREDLLAFGLILWELLLGIHPLRPVRPRGTAVTRQTPVGPQLAELATMSHFGRFFARLPAAGELAPMLPIRLQETLLTAIRLRLEDGELELAPGFRSFAEICDALAPVLGEPRAPAERTRTVRHSSPVEASLPCPACRRPVPFSSIRCPSCGRTAFDAAVESGQLQPSPFRPRWQISSWYGKGDGQEAPPCPRCGEKIRSDGSPRPARRGIANPPWNAGWDGACEHCGYRFELTLEQQLHFHARRSLQVRARNDFHQTFFDEAIVLSGIEIAVDRQEAGQAETAQTVFLAMAEVAALMQALEGDLSVYLAQYDWSEDWT